jgi:hypothetical protein
MMDELPQEYARAHPRFRSWYVGQSPDVRAAIDAFYDDTATHRGIAHGHRNREFARLTFTLQYAADTYGYDFTP